MRTTAFVFVALCLALLPAGCGGGDAKRPEIISSFPSDNGAPTGPVSELRVTYDQPVRILSLDEVQVRAQSRDVAIRVEQRPGEPNSIYIVPIQAGSFIPGEVHTAIIGAGLVVNDEDQYALEDFFLDFTNGGIDMLGVGRAGEVAWVAPNDFALMGSLATPGGRTPVGLLQVATATGPEFFVQLADGGGTGDSLQRFRPGDGAMTSIVLPTTGDLVSTTPAIVSTLDGRTLFVAFEDTGLGEIRVFRIDRATGAVETSTTTSLPAGASLTGFDISDNQQRLVVVADDAGTGRYVELLTSSLAELDLDPGTAGVQGAEAPGLAGQALGLRNNVAIAPAASAGLDQIAYGNGDRAISPFSVTGATSVLVRERLGAIVVHGLSGFAGDQALVLRTLPQSYTDPLAISISDDVGAGATGASNVTAGTVLPALNRYLFVLDTDVVIRMVWDGFDLQQIDEDAGTAGVQGIDVSGSVPGAILLARVAGQSD